MRVRGYFNSDNCQDLFLVFRKIGPFVLVTQKFLRRKQGHPGSISLAWSPIGHHTLWFDVPWRHTFVRIVSHYCDWFSDLICDP